MRKYVFDSYKSEAAQHSEKANDSIALVYTQPTSSRGNIKKSYFLDDCRCNVEKSMRPPFYCVSSQWIRWCFPLSSSCLLSAGVQFISLAPF